MITVKIFHPEYCDLTAEFKSQQKATAFIKKTKAAIPVKKKRIRGKFFTDSQNIKITITND